MKQQKDIMMLISIVCLALLVIIYSVFIGFIFDAMMSLGETGHIFTFLIMFWLYVIFLFFSVAIAIYGVFLWVSRWRISRKKTVKAQTIDSLNIGQMILSFISSIYSVILFSSFVSGASLLSSLILGFTLMISLTLFVLAFMHNKQLKSELDATSVPKP